MIRLLSGDNLSSAVSAQRLLGRFKGESVEDSVGTQVSLRATSKEGFQKTVYSMSRPNFYMYN